jgi:hypothetical protein
MAVIKINQLTKCYKKLTAVDNLNLEIGEGELFSWEPPWKMNFSVIYVFLVRVSNNPHSR